MFSKYLHDDDRRGVELELRAGWAEYRQALQLLEEFNWGRALVRLAEAETIFRTTDDQQGLWRVLLGQALLHWREGMAPLAIARALAALRAAEADDGFAAGYVNWQVAQMMLGQGEYCKAADYLHQAQYRLDSVAMAPLGSTLAAAAQLCNEIVRWQRIFARRQIGQREVKRAIAEIQQDLMACLRQVTTNLRAAAATDSACDRLEAEIMLMMTRRTLQHPLRAGGARPGWRAGLARLWRRLNQGNRHAPQQRARPTPAAPAAEQRGEAPPMAPPVAELTLQAPILEVEPPADSPAGAQRMLGETAAGPQPMLPPAQPAAYTGVQAPQQIGLAINCFGSFRVSFNDTHIERWESARARTIFKYLVARRQAPVPKDLLADLFWPDSEPELARRSLHQAIYCLRQTFKRIAPEMQFIQFVDDHYQINPEIAIWIDIEAFSRQIEQARLLQIGDQTEQAMKSYAIAIDLYQAPFLLEDRYEAWTDELRRSFQTMYLEALHCLTHYHYDRREYAAALLLCQRALAEESCDEDAHQLVMACYVAQGLRHLAVRQYQTYVSRLKAELGLEPSEDLIAFYQRTVATA